MLLRDNRFAVARRWRSTQSALNALLVVLGVALFVCAAVIVAISRGDANIPTSQISTAQFVTANKTPLTNASISNLPPSKFVVAVGSVASIIPVGELITVRRGGFFFGEFVQLLVASEPRVIGGGYSDSDGVVTITATIPQDLEIGEHTLVLYGSSSGRGFTESILVISSLSALPVVTTPISPQAVTTTSIPVATTTTSVPRLYTPTTPRTTSTTTTIAATSSTATQLALTHESWGTASGAVFILQPRVQVQDKDENRVKNSSAVVTATISAGGTLVGTTTATAVNGVAIFSSLGITGTAGTTYTITYSSGSLISASQLITVTTGAVAKLTVTRAAIGNTSGTAFTTQPRVAVQDTGGNTVTNSPAVINATVNAGGTLTGTTSANTVNGVATFSNLGINGASDASYTISFYTISYLPASPTAATQTLSVGIGGASYLALTRASVGSTPNVGFNTQPQITIKDAGGNTVTSNSSAVITATISGGGTLVGTTTATAVNGVATFSNLGISGTAGTTYTVTYYTLSLSGVTATSQLITVTHGAGTQLALTRPSVGTASGAAFTTQPQVSVLDVAGNTDTSVSSAVITATISAGGTLVGTTTATASSGMATFSNLGITGTAGVAYTITYSSSGFTSVTQSVTVTFGAATQLNLNRAAGNNQTSSPFNTQPRIHIFDNAGNLVTNSSAVVTATVSSGGSLTGTSTATAVSGVATFSNLGLTGAAGTYTITYSSGSLTIVTQTITL